MANKTHPTLGTRVTTYHVQPLRWRDLGTTFLPLIFSVLAPLGYGLWRTFYGYTNFGPASARYWGRFWFYTAGILLIFVLLYTLRRLLRAHRRVEIHSQGLRIFLPPIRRVDLRWEEISALSTTTSRSSFLSWKSKPRNKLKIIARDGKSLTLDHRFKELADLITLVKEQVYPLVKPRLVSAFHQGKELDFGAISLSRTGLRVQDQDLPWSYIKGLTAENGSFSIKLSPQKQIQVPLRSVYNIEILIQIIKEEV
ncbi:MAG: DUF6585 family protein [Anaerolineales bacterium]|nr:DUF6585 family protein [Anaerolineales bacterium]